MTEFTGERVVPGQVNVDLWNEHLLRYAFASGYAAGRDVLDLGCGTGYGSAELAAGARSVTGVEIAHDAVVYARSQYSLSNVRFVQASCTQLPIAGGRFGLVTAFEVIEHLTDWQSLIDEASRVLAADGIFLVSTPNRLYYAESRRIDGPNPYHQHEFEIAEFQAALAKTFSNTIVLLQNRTECQILYPYRGTLPVETRVDRAGGPPEDANFFLAVCSHRPLPELRTFVHIPRAANLLREREHHIALLERQLAEARGERDAMIAKHGELEIHLERQNRWAQELEEKWHAAQARIVELQQQFAAEQKAGLDLAARYEEKLRELEQDVAARTQWALDTEQRLTAEIQAERAERAAVLERLAATEATLDERTRWAVASNERLEKLDAQLGMIRGSRWISVGRKLGVGPDL